MSRMFSSALAGRGARHGFSPVRLAGGRASLAVGGVLFALVAIAAVFGPIVYPVDPNAQQLSERLVQAGAAHPLGTDSYGRDLLARILAGARASLVVGLAVVAVSSALGLVVGLCCTLSRIADAVLMRICDGLMSIPGVLAAIALMAMLGASMWNVVLALSIVYTPSMARIVRAKAMGVARMPYIEALRLQGASSARILALHIAPNVMGPFLVQAAFVFAEAVLSEATLSFLGLGVPAPDASWGNILQEGKAVASKAWWTVVYPALAIVVSVVGLNLLGDGLRDRFDPHARDEGRLR